MSDAISYAVDMIFCELGRFGCSGYRQIARIDKVTFGIVVASRECIGDGGVRRRPRKYRFARASSIVTCCRAVVAWCTQVPKVPRRRSPSGRVEESGSFASPAIFEVRARYDVLEPVVARDLISFDVHLYGIEIRRVVFAHLHILAGFYQVVRLNGYLPIERVTHSGCDPHEVHVPCLVLYHPLIVIGLGSGIQPHRPGGRVEMEGGC